MEIAILSLIILAGVATVDFPSAREAEADEVKAEKAKAKVRKAIPI